MFIIGLYRGYIFMSINHLSHYRLTLFYSMNKDRIDHIWTHRWSYRYQQTIFFDTYQPKEPNRWNLTFFKGELHALFSERMVEYLVESEIAKGYLQWCWNTGHPSEHYWNTLNYNKHAKAPGGYEGVYVITALQSQKEVSTCKQTSGE